MMRNLSWKRGGVFETQFWLRVVVDIQWISSVISEDVIRIPMPCFGTVGFSKSVAVSTKNGDHMLMMPCITRSLP